MSRPFLLKADMALWLDRCVRLIAARLRQDAWVYLAIAVYALFGMVVLYLTGNDEQAAYSAYVTQWTIVFLVFMPLMAVAIDITSVVLRFRRRRALAYRRMFSPRRMAHLYAGVILLMATMLFQGTFTSLKNLFPILHEGFPYDRLQADADRWLHFGEDPWRLLYAYGQYDVVRVVLEWNYNVAWFAICFGALFFVVTSPRADAIRARYLALFLFVWIVCGNIIAGTFLSAGPAFYGAVTGDPGRFAAQLAFLQAGDWSNSAAAYQNYLWLLYQQKVPGLGSGISAFPSVHVALITMNALFLAEFSKRLAIVGVLYTLVVIASSVYLGWHYAIDGYASVILVTGCYLLVRWWTRAPAEGQEKVSLTLVPG